MTARSFITRHSLSRIDCPLKESALSWWKQRNGVAELAHSSYLNLAPHLQVAMDQGLGGSPQFFYVGAGSWAAKLLGHNFTPAMQAGEWWDDGGYSTAISGIFSDFSANQEAAFEEIKALVHLPRHIMPSGSPVVLHYDRLSLPTTLENGQTTFTVVTTQKSMLQVVN